MHTLLIEMAENYGGCRIDENGHKNLAADILFNLVADVYDGRTTPMLQILEEIERKKQWATRELSKAGMLKEEIDAKIEAMLKDLYNDQEPLQ